MNRPQTILDCTVSAAVPTIRPVERMISRERTVRSPSKRPLTSAVSISAEPRKRPASAISTVWQSRNAASTLPSTTSLLQDLISPLRKMSRPTISFLTSPAPSLR